MIKRRNLRLKNSQSVEFLKTSDRFVADGATTNLFLTYEMSQMLQQQSAKGLPCERWYLRVAPEYILTARIPYFIFFN